MNLMWTHFFDFSGAGDQTTSTATHETKNSIADEELHKLDLNQVACDGACWLERLKVMLNHSNALPAALTASLNNAVQLCRDVRDAAKLSSISKEKVVDPMSIEGITVPNTTVKAESLKSDARPADGALSQKDQAWISKIKFECEEDIQKMLIKYGYPAGSHVELTSTVRPSGQPVRKNMSVGDVGVVVGVFDARMVLQFSGGMSNG